MEELFAILKEIIPNVDFKQEHHLVDEKILTSMNIIKLVAKLNETFDIKITPMHLTANNFNSIEAIFCFKKNQLPNFSLIEYEYTLLMNKKMWVGMIKDTFKYLKYYDELVKNLPNDYLSYIQKFKSKQYRLQSALNYLMLKQCLQKETKIIFNPLGKPFLNESDVYFNTSHLENSTICIIYHKNVGIDLVKIESYTDEIANLICNKEELKLCKNNHFEIAKLIAKKESYIKMRGQDLTYLKQSIPKRTKFIFKKISETMICSICYD